MSRHYYILVTIVLVFPWMRGPAYGEELVKRADIEHFRAPMAAHSHGELAPLPGIVQPSKQVTMSSPMEGMLMAVQVREGQRVRKGELLASIDSRVAKAAVNVARASAEGLAEITRAREELKFSQSLVERLLKLRLANGGSDFELFEARTRVEKAKATLLAAEQEQRRAKRQLELEIARLEAHDIRAPFQGQILRVIAQPGATLTRDDELLTIIRMDELEAELHVPLDSYDRLQVGRSYRLVAGPPLNRTLEGRLKYVAPVVDSATRTFRTVFVIANPNQELPAGFSVRLDTYPQTNPKTLAETQ